MKTWKRLRNSAALTEIILIVIALIAIVGLATFVHIRATRSPLESKKASDIAMNSEHMDTLAIDNDGSELPQPSTQTQTPKTTDTNVPDLQSAAPAPEAETSDGTHCGTSCTITEPVQTPPVTTPIVPITVQPVPLPPITKNPCGGLLQQQINSALKTNPDMIMCPMSIN